MLLSQQEIALPRFVAGDVLALMSPLQELPAGMYLLCEVTRAWAVLRWVDDDEAQERLMITERGAQVPIRLLFLFMPVGVCLPVPQDRDCTPMRH